ncbi:MAG: MoxR family ATPase [Candidatus Altiarchaeota archaeon]
MAAPVGIGIGKTVLSNEEKRVDEELERVYSGIGLIYKNLKNELSKVVVGQDEVILQILIAIFTKNHALLEGFPGLGKTLIISTIASLMDLKFKRIQCTPDLMPSDITGTYIIEEVEGKKAFRFEQGPVFTNILLADEINRATPKTQSALLEAMQERQISIGNATYPLEDPFFVLATQNPIEMEGTYPLPEAQIDRFMLKILVRYPKKEEEGQIITRYTSDVIPKTKKVLDKNTLLTIQELTRKVPISEENKNYALEVVTRTRPENSDIAKEFLEYGASPRASIALVLASKAKALIEGRTYVSRKDIAEMAFPVLRHRLILNFESERRGISTDEVIRRILSGV